MSDIIATYQPISFYGATWDEVHQCFLDDGYHARTLRELKRQVDAGIPIRETVTVEDGEVQDGHHRIVVAHYLCEGDMELEVTIREDDDEAMEEPDDLPYLMTEVHLPPTDSPDDVDVYIDALMSFAVSDRLWANAATAYGAAPYDVEHSVTFIWSGKPEDYSSDDIHAISVRVHEILADEGIEAISVRTYSGVF